MNYESSLLLGSVHLNLIIDTYRINNNQFSNLDYVSRGFDLKSPSPSPTGCARERRMTQMGLTNAPKAGLSYRHLRFRLCEHERLIMTCISLEGGSFASLN